MRLDKFLKVTRLIKRRSVGKEACDGERVLVNGKEAKPAKQIAAGDVISVLFGDNVLKVRVKKVPEGNVMKSDAEEYYEIV